MKTIHKAILTQREIDQLISLPKDFEFLDIQVQHGDIVFWYLRNLDETESGTWQVTVYGTGWDLPHSVRGRDYWGTVQDGSLVWHIFATKED